MTQTVCHDLDYLESPTDQQNARDAAAEPIDVPSLIIYLSDEIRQLLPYQNGEKSYDFLGDVNEHITSMQDAIRFLESNARQAQFLVAERDP